MKYNLEDIEFLNFEMAEEYLRKTINFNNKVIKIFSLMFIIPSIITYIFLFKRFSFFVFLFATILLILGAFILLLLEIANNNCKNNALNEITCLGKSLYKTVYYKDINGKGSYRLFYDNDIESVLFVIKFDLVDKPIMNFKGFQFIAPVSKEN